MVKEVHKDGEEEKRRSYSQPRKGWKQNRNEREMRSKLQLKWIGNRTKKQEKLGREKNNKKVTLRHGKDGNKPPVKVKRRKLQ